MGGICNMAESNESANHVRLLKHVSSMTRETLNEPIAQQLLRRSNLTAPQLETLILDLMIDDVATEHLPYELKASARTQSRRGTTGVSRGSFNRTLRQARRNIMRSLFTVMLLSYLGVMDSNPFRGFEEIASRIIHYRRIREDLASRTDLHPEDIASYTALERSIVDAIEELTSPLALKSNLSSRKPNAQTR